MSKNIPKKIHFMGIGGSGISAAAEIAKACGFEVSGCDLKTGGHDVNHLEKIDILAVTPAAFFQSAHHPELVEGQKRGMVMTWQEFAGKYLTAGKDIIAIAGTHGKSTTTALAGLLLETAGLDPTAIVGATVPSWSSNARIGKGKYFVVEADEYYHNFLHYQPDVIILNNIEMDHPEYFGSREKVVEAYQKFVSQIKSRGLLIFNADSPLVSRIEKPANSVFYSLEKVKIVSQTPEGTDFEYHGQKYHLQIPGLHNVANALGVIELADYLKIPYRAVDQVFTAFGGIERRLQLIGTARGVTVLDDYANHPSAFKATLQATTQKYPDRKIWAVIEPHTFSRLRAVLSDLPDSLAAAGQVIISKIFASRESDPGDFSGADIAQAVPGSRYIPDFPDIAEFVKTHTRSGDVILVMGSGNSCLLARQIYQALIHQLGKP